MNARPIRRRAKCHGIGCGHGAVPNCQTIGVRRGIRRPTIRQLQIHRIVRLHKWQDVGLLHKNIEGVADHELAVAHAQRDGRNAPLIRCRLNVHPALHAALAESDVRIRNECRVRRNRRDRKVRGKRFRVAHGEPDGRGRQPTASEPVVGRKIQRRRALICLVLKRDHVQCLIYAGVRQSLDDQIQRRRRADRTERNSHLLCRVGEQSLAAEKHVAVAVQHRTGDVRRADLERDVPVCRLRRASAQHRGIIQPRAIVRQRQRELVGFGWIKRNDLHRVVQNWRHYGFGVANAVAGRIQIERARFAVAMF